MKKEIFEGIEDQENFFLPLEKQRLVLYLIESIHVPHNSKKESLVRMPSFTSPTHSAEHVSYLSFEKTLSTLFGKKAKKFYPGAHFSNFSVFLFPTKFFSFFEVSMCLKYKIIGTFLQTFSSLLIPLFSFRITLSSPWRKYS